MREIGDAREPYPGYFTTTKYVRNNGIISHMHIPHMHAVPAPPHQEKMVPRKAYPGYARVLHPGYFTNKYPLWAKSNIPQTRTHHRLPYWYRTRTPAHPHTRTPAHRHTQTSNPRPTTQPHPPSRLNQGGGVYLVSTIFLSKILCSTSCKPSLSL